MSAVLREVPPTLPRYRAECAACSYQGEEHLTVDRAVEDVRSHNRVVHRIDWRADESGRGEPR